MWYQPRVFDTTGVAHEQSEEAAPRVGWEPEGWLSPHQRRRSACAQPLFCLASHSFLSSFLSPLCMASVRLLLQSGGLSAHRRRSATATAEDWQRHPETPLWAGHHGPGKERSPAQRRSDVAVWCLLCTNSLWCSFYICPHRGLTRAPSLCCFIPKLAFTFKTREYYVLNVYMLFILQMIVLFVCFPAPL